MRTIGLGLAAIGLAAGATIATAGHADAAPYGGCKEAWQAPHSQGARECRSHGWTVRPHFTIDPHNVLRATDFRPCREEDSNGCFWNADVQGNGRGTSFVASRTGEVFWVRIPRGMQP